MNDHHHDHHELIDAVAGEYEELFGHSTQAMYIYFDDEHKVCNKKFATLLGYTSPEEWADVHENFPEVFVAKKSQETLVSAYQEAMEHGVGSTNSIVWKKKDGKDVSTTVILVPIVYDGHLFALHFVTK